MKTLKIRITFLLLLIFLANTIPWLSEMFYKSELQDLNVKLEQSENVQKMIDDLKPSNISADEIQNLQKYRQSLEEKDRQILLSDIVQAYQSKNDKNFSRKAKAYFTNENIYQKNWEQKRSSLEQKTILYRILGWIISLVFSAALFALISMRIFTPLKETNEKMMDFMAGKYQYKFFTHSRDEIGSLQGTFNSIAQKVNQNMEELKALDEAKSDFLNIASHELRTPMTSIKGSLGLITSGVMGKLEEPILQLCKIAEEETDRLIRMTNDFLDLAKIEAGRLPLTQKWISLNDLIQKTASSLTGLQEASNVHIDIVEVPAVEVFADFDRIQQVLTNLLSNAIKFSPQGKVVEIFSYVHEQLVIEVIDHGRGIAKEDQELIFQKFRQATNAQNPLVKGTGLGLAIAKAISESHGGMIGVKSRPNHGSTFYFTLPEWRENESILSENRVA